MKELQIKISQEPAVIRCNFEDVKAQLSAKMAEYQGAVPGASAPRKSRRNKGYPAAGQICADSGTVRASGKHNQERARKMR